MKTRHINIVILLLFITACNSKFSRISEGNILKQIEVGTDSTYKREYIPNPNKSLYAVFTHYFGAPVKTFVYYYDIDKKNVSEIKTYMMDKMYGHYFEFYNDGCLKQYTYMVGNNYNSYVRKYTTDRKLELEEGTPYVDAIVDNNRNADLFFIKIFCDSLSVEVSSKNMPLKNLILTKSAMQPMLLEGRIRAVDTTYFLKITAIGNNFKERKIYNDTINIAK